MLRVDPESFTLRELWWMIRGHDKDEWNRTSTICAMIHNFSGFVKQAVSPDEFNPYVDKAKNSSGVRSIPLKKFAKYICKEPEDG